MPRVVAEPFSLCVVVRRRERNGPADLDDHLRYGLSHSRDLLVELVEILRAVTGFRIPDMEVQHSRAGVVAIDRLLRLLLPGNGYVFRVVARKPLRPIRRHRDDQRLLIFGKH